MTWLGGEDMTEKISLISQMLVTRGGQLRYNAATVPLTAF